MATELIHALSDIVTILVTVSIFGGGLSEYLQRRQPYYFRRGESESPVVV